MIREEAINIFTNTMSQRFQGKYDLHWDIDKKGLVCGWCKLSDPGDISVVAELIAGFKGRVMTISPLITGNGESEHIEINYHFYFKEINCTVCIALPDGLKKVDSITPILKSADWHEREMQELYNIEVQGHPNPQKLFIDGSIQMTDRTMIPLSEAMNGASTNTLWEKIMGSGNKGAKNDE